MEWAEGTAIRLSSAPPLDLRDEIVAHFHGLLTMQDSHRSRLHVTVQNKMSPKVAKTLQAQLTVVIMKRNFTFPGLALHRYRSGPWEFVRCWSFRGK